MAETSAMVNVVRFQHHPSELLGYVVFLVGALARGDNRYLIAGVLAEFLHYKT
jgi:hypothetical protein